MVQDLGSGSNFFRRLSNLASCSFVPSHFLLQSALISSTETYTYNIPKNLPSGDYLLRIQQLGIHNPYPSGIPQFYISCAQVTVTGGGTGVPGPLVSIPGFIDGTESGYTVNIYDPNFKSYTVPGPAVWDGAPGNGKPVDPTSAASVGATSTAGITSVASTFITSTTSTAPVVVPPTSTTVAAPVSTEPVAPKYGQCGGQDWRGATVCVAGTVCKSSGAYYSQCL